MAIVGTAGHVDHGKSTLVRALTGIDPDRLAEEKRRGMTIDLGFAHLDLPDGRRVGIVDVPGHARFVHNMLAGVHGLDAVLLVVAADEGVMPQTREHLDILQLLDVGTVVTALTKTDLVDSELLELVTEDVRAELARRGLGGPVLPVDAVHGVGLEPLVTALAEAVGAPPGEARGGAPRLPVDRAFIRPGFGVVVTGSLVDGPLGVGEEVEVARLQGAPLHARVRGLQQHGVAVERAEPGSRVAVNLQGVAPGDVARGDVVARPGALAPTQCADVRLRLLADAPPLRRDTPVVFHAGTAEVQGRVRPLDLVPLEPGGEGYAQVRLAGPCAIRNGDRFVLRRPSPAATVGGGEVVDAAARPHRRRSAAVVASLEARAAGDDLLEELRRAPAGAVAAELGRGLGRPAGDVTRELEDLRAAGTAVRAGDLWFAAEAWASLAAAAARAVAEQHRRAPLRPGLPREALRGALGLDARGVAAVADALVAEGVLTTPRADLVAAPGFVPTPSAAQQRAADAVLAALGQSPLAPPTLSELQPLGLDPELLGYLEDSGRVVRISPDLVLLATAVTEAEGLVRRHLEARATMTVADARDLLGSSRRTVVPLLEHFDATRVTRRDGDLRRLRVNPVG